MTRMSHHWQICLSGLAILALAGCGGSDASSSSTAENSNSSTESNSASPNTADNEQPELVGIWLGVGYLDDNLLAQKIATISDPAERDQFISIANSFRSTRLGVAFNDDKSYQLDMAIVDLAGQQRRAETTGTWKIVQADGGLVVVEQHEVTEQDSKQAEYSFSDSDHFAYVPPVAEVLLDCNPLIVFERQLDVDDSAGAEASTADANANSGVIRN